MPKKKGWRKICDYDKCNKSFFTPRDAKRFCSVKCRNASYYQKNREVILEDRKNYYQETKIQRNKVKIEYLRRIYNDCEKKMKKGVIKNATKVHEIFSYLNHNPQTNAKLLLLEYPRKSGKQLMFLHYYWLKFTKEKYNIAISNEEQDLISRTFRDFSENKNVKS